MLCRKNSINHTRIIQEAKRLFIHTNESGKTIAYEPGFENEAYFSRFFKKSTGFSPRDSQKQVHQNLGFLHFLNIGTFLL